MKDIIIKLIGLAVDGISAGIRARQECKKRDAEKKNAIEQKRIAEQQAYHDAQKRAQQQAQHAARVRAAALKETDHRP